MTRLKRVDDLKKDLLHALIVLEEHLVLVYSIVQVASAGVLHDDHEVRSLSEGAVGGDDAGMVRDDGVEFDFAILELAVVMTVRGAKYDLDSVLIALRGSSVDGTVDDAVGTRP